VLDETLVLPSSVVSIRLQRESNLLAVICDDLTVRIFDLETKRLVRELVGFKGRLLDIVSWSDLNVASSNCDGVSVLFS
jgi:U3 small nucleolar RNA-associated protein 21